MPRSYPPEVRRQVIELARAGAKVRQLAATFRMLAIVEWIGWFNTVRLHSALGDRPPLEFERTELSGSTVASLAGSAGSHTQMGKLETT